MTIAFAYYTTAGVDSPLWLLEFVMFLQGAGIGNVMPPSTAAIMASVPRAKAGEGSAIGNTSRQLGGALGVAILGSILSSAYRSSITPHLRKLPGFAHDPSALHEVSSSITATLSYAAHAGPHGAVLTATATSAFIDAMHSAAAGSVLVGAIATIVALRWLPSRLAPAPQARTISTEPPAHSAPAEPVLIEA
jgi:hypothetical protein